MTALAPILSRRHGAWIGWPGWPTSTLEPTTTDGLSLHPVTLTTDDVDNYYEGFSNETLWPLYHDAVAPPASIGDWWEAYQRVNERFAEAAAEVAAAGRDGLGARLPAAAGAACSARCGPTCGSASSCTSRSRRSSCSCGCRGARRSSTGCSAPT